VRFRLLPCPHGLPPSIGGSASTTSLSRPAQASRVLRPIRLFAHLKWTLSRGSSPVGYPSKLLVSYRALPMAARVGPSPTGGLPFGARDRAEARALGHEKTQSRFLGPPCNPGRSDFPIPVLALAIPERSFRDRGSSSARSHTPHPCRFTSRLVLSIMAPPTYAVGHTGTAKCPELLCLSQV
jgi:hypothetical protein